MNSGSGLFATSPGSLGKDTNLRYFDRVVSLLQNRFGKIQSGDTETFNQWRPIKSRQRTDPDSTLCASCVQAECSFATWRAANLISRVHISE